MSHLLGLEGVGAVVGARPLLAGVTLGLEDGMRVGVLGRNGAGKSTLLALLAGRREPDAGRVTRAGGTRVVTLDQADDLPPEAAVRDVVHPGVAEHVWASQPTVRDIHAGLLTDVPLDAAVGTLSGGQRRRVALARVLTTDAEVLVLDEPTNHLDVEGVDWLARHLQARYRRGAGALVVVTHDRWFLDAVCSAVWEVVPGDDGPGGRAPRPGHVETYEGGYAAYVLARAERSRTAALAEEKRANLLRKELAWLRRGAPARTAKPKFRLDAAAALVADEPPPRDPLELTRLATARLGKDVLDLEDVTVVYPPRPGDPQPAAPAAPRAAAGGHAADAPDGGHAGDAPDGGRVVLADVTWRLAPGERVGLVGVNGAGKSTLLRLLAGTQQPTSGRVRRGKTVQVAQLSQETDELDAVAHLRVVEAVEQVRGRVQVGGKELTAGQLVERLGFTRERAWTPVADLSGGERRRLQLLRLLVAEPNVLLLDEPTNDLDTDTLAAVEDLLDGWPGTLVVVSHDRYLLERITDHQVALLGDGGLRDLPGGVEQYLELRRAQAKQAASDRPGATAASAVPAESEERSAMTGAERRAAQKEIGAIERRLEKLSGSIEAVHQRLADHDQSDYEGLRQHTDRVRQLETEVAQLEERWLELSELVG
ncbi:ABC-F family ATP-binding cassette domain-containing protein [Georgenia sp. TF02-10]|uniref:ABC-F family ATP-binding cassette domain-containing protein n=1 Tax=Georgenia sp. TF02-10 TaxID=2917725 RepID=UPI001FA754D0|nr:ABC-F family ATP-binding cassette domain-containing protein [Georgenia sp. TF02-10]UNX55555.1 ABC-F family ATP-binding cassette domain-containing protein [Georgenia sp. TF02-10]